MLKYLIQAAPQYKPNILALHNLGYNCFDISRKILDKRFTFTRGIKTSNPWHLISFPIETTRGRSDTEVFGDVSADEDIGYMSNSIGTSIAYTYPEYPGDKMIGIIKLDPTYLDWSGSPVKWLKNNTIGKFNIKTSPSVDKIKEDKYYDHFIVKGKRGAQYPYLYLYGCIKLPYDSSNIERYVPWQITRQHYGDYTTGFSKG